MGTWTKKTFFSYLYSLFVMCSSSINANSSTAQNVSSSVAPQKYSSGLNLVRPKQKRHLHGTRIKVVCRHTQCPMRTCASVSALMVSRNSSHSAYSSMQCACTPGELCTHVFLLSPTFLKMCSGKHASHMEHLYSQLFVMVEWAVNVIRSIFPSPLSFVHGLHN